MPISLLPQSAAEMASYVYEYRLASGDLIDTRFPRSLKNDFKLTGTGPIKGKTGILLSRRTSGFIITAEGVSSRYQNHALVAIRGTDKKFVPDLITDMFAAVGISLQRKLVHGGFNRTFNSFKSDLIDYVRSTRPQCIHVVGHSLGGALANLTAAMLQAEFGIPVKLYTFGAPRVGLEGFVDSINLNAYIDHYRVSHIHDPVTVVPVWPFMHAGFNYVVAGSVAQSFSLGAHAMSIQDGYPGYIETASRFKSYLEMHDYIDHESRRERIILDYKDIYKVQCNAEWERKIRLCMITLLHDLKFTGFAAVQSVGVSMFTVYDLIARFFEQMAKAAETAAERVKGLLGHILAFVGQAGRQIKNLSYAFIREVFNLMLNKLTRMARDAINRHG